MKCNVCGRETQNDEANFCEYCGSSFKENKDTSFYKSQGGQGYPYASGQMSSPMSYQNQDRINGAVNAAEEDKPVSFLNWLGTYGILFIPFVGGLIFIIMLFVWAFSGSTNSNKKSWARATLIIVAVTLILVIVNLILLFNNEMFQDMMNNYSSYFEEMNGSYY